MSQSFDTDAFEDLFYEADEGPSHQRRHAGGAEAWDEADLGDAWDEGESWDEFGDADDGMDVMDAMEDAVAAALDADDTDEFFRRALRGLRRRLPNLRSIGRTLGN